MGRIRKALTYGNITATVAMFLAMSGAAVAVTTAPTNSVTSSSIKDGQVKTPDIGAGAVTNPKIAANSVGSGKVADGSLSGTDVRDGSLRGADLADESVNSGKIADDAVGSAKIAPGAVGYEELADDSVSGIHIADRQVGPGELETNSVGARQLNGVIAVVGAGVTVNAGTPRDAEVACPGGTRLIAGGFSWQEDEPNSIIGSFPNELHPNDTWIVRGIVNSGSNTLYPWANCLKVE